MLPRSLLLSYRRLLASNRIENIELFGVIIEMLWWFGEELLIDQAHCLKWLNNAMLFIAPTAEIRLRLMMIMMMFDHAISVYCGSTNTRVRSQWNMIGHWQVNERLIPSHFIFRSNNFNRPFDKRWCNNEAIYFNLLLMIGYGREVNMNEAHDRCCHQQMCSSSSV